jgi:hypothetical protein
MLRNFTAVDIASSVEASVLFALILFIPGYTVGWLSNVFEFRERRLGVQALLSSPLAVAVMPILVYLLGPHPTALWTLFGASWLGFALLIPRIWKRWSPIRTAQRVRLAWIGVAFGLAWALLAIVSLVDLQFGDRLYFTSIAYDYALRSAFTAAAARAIPPANPFFAAIPPVPLRYHYFWMLVCSLTARLGNVAPRQAMYGGTVWAGLTLMSLIVMLLKFSEGSRDRLQQKVVIGWSLLLVTGLDILPNLYLYLHSGLVNPDMEWWNAVQITSWVDSLLWVPHHVMSLVAGMVGLLVLRQPAATRLRRAIAIVIAGLAFASSAGLSVLVAFTFAVFAGLWILFAAYRRWWDDVKGLLAAGAVSAALAAFYISTLVGPALDGSGGNGRFFAISIRDFPFGTDLMASWLHISPQTIIGQQLLLLLLLPLNYLFELGFFLLVAALRINSIRTGSTQMSRQEQTTWMMVGTSFLIGSFVRSTTISSNDLGWRCFLPTQLVLLVWAASLIDEWRSAPRIARPTRKMAPAIAGVLLTIGVIGTAYQVAMLRVFPILLDEGKFTSETVPFLDQDGQLGRRTYALRSAYESLSVALPAESVVQYNPDARAFIPHQLYSGHSAAMGLPYCGANFGGDVFRCIGRMELIPPLFRKPSRAESDNLDSICTAFGIDAMLVDDSDYVWRVRDSWVWNRQPLLANDHVRAFACGDRSQQTRFAAAR